MVQRELEAVLEQQQRLAAAAQAIAQGNLAREVQGSGDLERSFKDMLAGLRKLVGQVKDAAIEVDSGAQAAGQAIRSADAAVAELEGAISSIAGGAGEQMRQVEAAAEAIGRVSGEVDQVAQAAADLAVASERALTQADRGAEAVRATVLGMREIADSSAQAAERVRNLDALAQQIGAVVATIDDIAEQTNLLALNAAIEAARAGSHGRGFAVVAGEVRKLAERSKRETRQIEDLVRGIQGASAETVRQILADAEAAQRERSRADQAVDALNEIIAAVQDAAGRVGSIAESADAARDGTRALGNLMEPVRTVAEDNALATRAMAARVNEVAGAMREAREGIDALSETAERLRRHIAHFQLTDARRQSVSIPVTARSSAWPSERSAIIVDLSATGARIDGLQAPAGTELRLTFSPAAGQPSVQRRAKVMRVLSSDAGEAVGVAFVDTPAATRAA
jgi:methyl-accepting chemotaxis protein